MDGTVLRRLAELDRRERRRQLIRSALVITLSWLALFGGYYLAPFDNSGRAGALTRFLIGGLIFLAVVAWQVVRVLTSPYPRMRAVEALGVVVALFLVLFAGSYLTMEHADPGSFSERLTHTKSLYFTITVLSTVGFGDITPRTDLARALVSAQMLLNLGLLAAVARLIVRAARARDQPLSSEAAPES